jgi:hypothetical protein
MCPLRVLSAEDLAPRAYLIMLTHSNAIILAYSQFSGSLEFAGAVPIAGATANANLLIFSYYHTLNFFGRTASVTIAMPYGIGNFRVPRLTLRNTRTGRDSWTRLSASR